ncbi:unnamed protein product [Prorocentrum cordatum]|uniref:Protein-tyrosine sulfotransferase n=1 Tax=Prorocentrum cordatum TaxID=2364126 RepID=A0ABN9VCV6_9DINO|nr:unnamed protein product [Polarella glacialis]
MSMILIFGRSCSVFLFGHSGPHHGRNAVKKNTASVVLARPAGPPAAHAAAAPPGTRCAGCDLQADEGWFGQRKFEGVFFCRACWGGWQEEPRVPPVFVLGLPKLAPPRCRAPWSLPASDRSTATRPSRGPSPRIGVRVWGSLRQAAVEKGKRPLAFLPPWVDAVTQMDCWWSEPRAAPSTATPAASGAAEAGERPGAAAERPGEAAPDAAAPRRGAEPEGPAARGIFPQITMLKELDKGYPGARFILSTRDTRAWVQSVTNYYHLRQILVDADLPGLPSGVGSADDELAAWFEAHTARVRAHFAGREAEAFLSQEGDERIRDRLQRFLGRPLEWGRHNETTWA